MTEHSSQNDPADPATRSQRDDADDGAAIGVSAGDAAAFRAAYGTLRGPLKRRSDRFSSLETWLAQAQFDRTTDEYLASAVRRSAVAAAAAFVFFAVLLGGVAPRVDALAFPSNYTGLTGATVVTAVGLTGGVFVLSLLAHYYYPRVWATWRRRHIDADLPHAVVFMYVLSEAGLDLQETLRRVADSEETYGEVAREFRGIVVDMDRFGLDTLTALKEAKGRTPSTELAEFLDDLGNVIESGGHLDGFLETRSENQLRQSRQRQENLLETVAAIVEGYITIVFAGPIFLVTILVIMGFIGVNTLVFVNLMTYLVIPAGIVGFLAFFGLFNRPYERSLRLEPDEQQSDDTVTEGPEVSAYRRASRIRSVGQFIDQPVVSMQQRPVLSLALTVPAAILVWFAFVAAGVATPAEYSEDPIRTTTMLGVVPALIPSAGLMLADESERRRAKSVRRRLPEVLRGLGDSTKNGVLLPDAISLAARRSEGALATHLQRLDNEIRVTGNLQRAIRTFAAEVGVSRVTRVSKILVEGHQTSGSLENVLEISSEDARERYRLDVEWRHAMQPYVAFFLIGVLVYTFIILIFVEVFFPILTDAGVEALGGRLSFGPSDSTLPVTAYEAALYHSLLIQAVGNGLVMGKLVEGSLISGLKYVNPLLVIVVVIFYVV
jgi:flagellar protein FlaJ